jgi:hypothetical protein
MTGWQCPGCSRCFAPSMIQCPNCGPGVGVSTTGVTPICVHQYDYSTSAPYCKKCGAWLTITTFGVTS